MYDISKYINLKQEGKSPIEAYLIAKAEGLDPLSCMGILCEVYHLSLIESKEVMIKSDYGGKSLDEFQKDHVLPALKDAFEVESHDDTGRKKIEDIDGD